MTTPFFALKQRPCFGADADDAVLAVYDQVRDARIVVVLRAEAVRRFGQRVPHVGVAQLAVDVHLDVVGTGQFGELGVVVGRDDEVHAAHVGAPVEVVAQRLCPGLHEFRLDGVGLVAGVLVFDGPFGVERDVEDLPADAGVAAAKIFGGGLKDQAAAQLLVRHRDRGAEPGAAGAQDDDVGLVGPGDVGRLARLLPLGRGRLGASCDAQGGSGDRCQGRALDEGAP